MKQIKLIGLALLTALGMGAMSGAALAQTSSEPITSSAAASNQATDIDWTQYKGKVVYIDFWASWCGPCRQSFPWMNAMHQQYAKDGLVVLAINVDQEPGKAAEFLKEVPAQFTIKYDPKGKLAEQFGVQTMPSSFILDRQGKPASKHMGFHEANVPEYEQELKALLAQKP